MNDTIKAIVELLESGRPELQVAAAQVLGELRSTDEAAINALGNGLDRSPVLGRFCLDALGKIATEPALAKMAEAVVEYEVLSDHAAHLLGEVGAPAHLVLAEIYPEAIGEQRGRILSVLGRELSPESLEVVVDALLTSDLSQTAAGLLESGKEQLTPAMVKSFREGVQARIADAAVSPAIMARVIAVLASVDAKASMSLFLEHIEADAAPQVRSAAFRALQGTELAVPHIKLMMESLEDSTQKSVHDAIREVLLQLPQVPPSIAQGLKRLLTSRQPEQRLFALRMLRTSGGAELAKSFLKLLDHDDARFREAACAGLANNKQAVEPVLKLMQSSKNPDVSRACSGIMSHLAEHVGPKQQKATADKAIKLLATNARLGDLLLDLVLLAGGKKIVAYLVDKAVRMRRAHKPSEALHVLAKIAASDFVDDEVHYQIALIKLLASADQAEGVEVPGNSTMGFFAVLIRAGFPLFERLKNESSVKPEMLLRIATYFSSAVGAERRFGAEALQYLADRTKGKAGDEARIALRGTGV
jgi:hypothetical protein